MKHAVIFKNRQNKWDNALPLGNGVFGSMLFYEKNKLFMPMNHYEVYYNIRKNVLPEDIYKAMPDAEEPGAFHREKLKRAELNQPTENDTYSFYGSEKEETFNKKNYAIKELSNSYPPTGDIVFSFADSMEEADSYMALYVEEAKAELKLEKDGRKIEIDTIVSRKDCIITKVTQNQSGLLKAVRISFEPYRKSDYPDIKYQQIDERTFAYTVARYLSSDSERPFVFSGIISFVGAEGTLSSDSTGADIEITKADKEFTVLTSVFTDWKYGDPLNDGLPIVREYEKSIDEMYREHGEYWAEFFTRGKITLPDEFLEHIYYVNQYALDCCSGKDGIMKHHACGLNGLWAIRHPNIWGSMWYWDVNIQAAFAGVFSSNRLDLGKVFSDGLLTYVKLGEKSARNLHGVSGCASDYPYSFYYCCWLWCAQYLWFQYEYSLDVDYLRNDAYPLFLKLAEFITNIFEYDPKTDTYNVYPDISPEQGPLAHNTTITVACTKYLCKFTLEAAEILGDNSPVLEKCRDMLAKMPEYALSGESMYGVHYKDSPDAPDNMWIRHPSMLMPLFPIGEFDLDSDKEILEHFSNTVDFLEDRSELGIFIGSWLAAAAARLGRGQTALRLIYERGADHMLRSNGLTAEETDHFINYCLITRQPLYYPCMMEFTERCLQQ